MTEEPLFQASHDRKDFSDIPPMNSETWDTAIEYLKETLDEDGIPIKLSEPTFFVSKEFAEKPENIQSMANFHSRVMEYGGVKYYPELISPNQNE